MSKKLLSIALVFAILFTGFTLLPNESTALVPGNDDYHYNYPHSICTDGDYIYITDSSNNRIVKRVAHNGTFVDEVGSAGSGDTQFNNPLGISYYEGQLYVADNGNHRIILLDADDLSYVNKINLQDTVSLYYPTDVVAYNNCLYITNDMTGYECLKINTTNFAQINSGVYSFVGAPGMGSPDSITIDDSTGKIYIADNNRIYIRWASNMTQIMSKLAFNSAVGMAIDGDYIYIANSATSQIRKCYKENLTLIASYSMFDSLNLDGTTDVMIYNGTMFVVDSNDHEYNNRRMVDNPFGPLAYTEVNIDDLEINNGSEINGVARLIFNKDWVSCTITSDADFIEGHSFVGFNTTTYGFYGVPDVPGVYYVHVLATRDEEGPVYCNFTLTVLDISLYWVDNSPLESVYELSSYAYTFATNQENTTFTLYTDAEWLELDNDTGLLSGVASEGVYNISIMAIFPIPFTFINIYHNYTLTVFTPFSWVNHSPGDYLYVDQSYSYQFTTNKDGPTYTMSGNATWLSINSTTGVLIGVANETGSFAVNITATWNGYVLYHNYTILVEERMSMGERIEQLLWSLFFILVAIMFLIFLLWIDKSRRKM